jgi:hypothetical protein
MQKQPSFCDIARWGRLQILSGSMCHDNIDVILKVLRSVDILKTFGDWRLPTVHFANAFLLQTKARSQDSLDRI